MGATPCVKLGAPVVTVSACWWTSVPAVPLTFRGAVAETADEVEVSFSVLVAPAIVGVTVVGVNAQVTPVGSGATHAGVTAVLKPWSAKKVTVVDAVKD